MNGWVFVYKLSGGGFESRYNQVTILISEKKQKKCITEIWGKMCKGCIWDFIKSIELNIDSVQKEPYMEKWKKID